MSDDNFISRWSRRKHQARRGDELAQAPPAAAPPATESSALAPPVEAPDAPVETPPLDTLTPESDFTPFMNAKVDPGLRRQALKTLFSDPRYNVMDGLDVYIDDYSKPDPLPEGWLEKMNQMARLGDYQPPPEEVDEPERVAAQERPSAIEPPSESQAPAGSPPLANPEGEGDSSTAPKGDL